MTGLLLGFVFVRQLRKRGHCILVFNILSFAFIICSLPLIGVFEVCANRSSELTLAAIRQLEEGSAAEGAAAEAEAKSAADLEKAEADRAAAEESREAAAAATEESAAAKAKAAEDEARAAASESEAAAGHAAAEAAGEAAAAHAARAAAEREQSFQAAEAAAADEARSEADEGVTGALAFVPGVDIVAGAIGSSIAVSLHVKEAAEAATAAGLAAKAHADSAASAEEAAQSASSEAAAAEAQAAAEAAAADAARQQGVSAESSETAQQEEAAAIKEQEAAAAEQEDAAAQKEVEAEEQEAAARAFERAAGLRLEAFVYQVMALAIATPLVFIVLLRKATKIELGLGFEADLLALGIVLRDLRSAIYMLTHRRKPALADQEGHDESAGAETHATQEEKTIALALFFKHFFGFCMVCLFAAPEWLRGVRNVGHTPRDNLNVIMVASVLAATRMIVACLKAAGYISMLVFTKHLIDHAPQARERCFSIGFVLFQATRKGLEALTRTLTFSVLLIVVGLFFSYSLGKSASHACDVLAILWELGVWWVVAGLAVVAAIMTLVLACKQPSCRLWCSESQVQHVDYHDAQKFVTVLRETYVLRRSSTVAVDECLASCSAHSRLSLENLHNRVLNFPPRGREQVIHFVWQKLGMQFSDERHDIDKHVAATIMTGTRRLCGAAFGAVASILYGVVGFFESEIELLIVGLGTKQWLSCGTIFSLMWPFVWAQAPSTYIVLKYETLDIILATIVYCGFARRARREASKFLTQEECAHGA